MDNENGINIETLSELFEGATVFESRGYSTVRVTRAGKPVNVRIPIKSTGIADLQEELSGKAPRPPVLREVIKAASPEGKALGLISDGMARTFDLTDERYVEALEKHNREYLWRVAVAAMDMPFKAADGRILADYADKVRVLKAQGITTNQITQIFKDVQDLTRHSEERADFLSGARSE